MAVIEGSLEHRIKVDKQYEETKKLANEAGSDQALSHVLAAAREIDYADEFVRVANFTGAVWCLRRAEALIDLAVRTVEEG
jgi:hypothetical protein